MHQPPLRRMRVGRAPDAGKGSYIHERVGGEGVLRLWWQCDCILAVCLVSPVSNRMNLTGAVAWACVWGKGQVSSAQCSLSALPFLSARGVCASVTLRLDQRHSQFVHGAERDSHCEFSPCGSSIGGGMMICLVGPHLPRDRSSCLRLKNLRYVQRVCITIIIHGTRTAACSPTIRTLQRWAMRCD